MEHSVTLGPKQKSSKLKFLLLCKKKVDAQKTGGRRKPNKKASCLFTFDCSNEAHFLFCRLHFGNRFASSKTLVGFKKVLPTSKVCLFLYHDLENKSQKWIICKPKILIWWIPLYLAGGAEQLNWNKLTSCIYQHWFNYFPVNSKLIVLKLISWK